MSLAPATRALSRLAWRELRQRPGRSILVAALVALPVAALVVAAILTASSVASPQDARAGAIGRADVVVRFADERPTDRAVVAEVLRRVPEGSRVLRVREREVAPVPVRNRDVLVEVSDLPLHDPLTIGMTKLLRGRAPVGAGEVAAASTVLRDLGLRIGDMLVSRRLGLRARITAEAIDPNDLDRPRVLTGAPLPDEASRTRRLLVALPPHTTAESAVQELRGPGREVRTAANCCRDERPQAREVTLAVSGLALFIVGLVVAAAFAISARRQLRLIGLLSAAAGADERHVRRLAVLQGTLCGAVGVSAGFVLGFAVVAIAVAPSIDDLTGRVTGGVTVPMAELALIAAMAIAATAIGAWLPGRTASRIPLLAALGGRHPLRPVPATVPVRGLATSALGTALLALALNDLGPRGMSTAGTVLIVLGFVQCVPALVALLEPLATRARGITRLAARDIARQRARTGPLVAAILAVASLAVLGSTLIRSEEAFRHDLGEVASDEVLLSSSVHFFSPGDRVAVSAQLRERIHALLPGATQTEISFHERRAADGTSEGAVVQRSGRDIHGFGVAIGGPQLLEFLGARAGRAALERGDAVALAPGLIDDGHLRVSIPQSGRRARHVRLPATEIRADRPVVSFVVSPRTAARHGLASTATDVVFRTPSALTADQRRAIQALAIASDRSASGEPVTEIVFAGKLPHQGIVRGLHEALLAIAALLALAVVASGLALAAAEGRADDTMLTALGADPTSRRRLRATQAGLLVGMGGLLALPAGLIPAMVFVLDADELRFAVPWSAIAIALVALPAAAAAGAWLLTRPARWSPPATWAD